jgi:hypothetical protein
MCTVTLQTFSRSGALKWSRFVYAAAFLSLVVLDGCSPEGQAPEPATEVYRLRFVSGTPSGPPYFTQNFRGASATQLAELLEVVFEHAAVAAGDTGDWVPQANASVSWTTDAGVIVNPLAATTDASGHVRATAALGTAGVETCNL